jgi:hypothetical protein
LEEIGQVEKKKIANNETDNKPFGAQLQERYRLLRYDTIHDQKLKSLRYTRSITLRENKTKMVIFILYMLFSSNYGTTYFWQKVSK